MHRENTTGRPTADARGADQIPVTASRLPLRALMPRHRAPAILDHLRGSGAPFETGKIDDAKRTVEVLTSHAGGELLERHGLATTRAGGRARWPDPTTKPSAGSLAHLAGPSPADPLEVAFRREAARVRARAEAGTKGVS